MDLPTLKKIKAALNGHRMNLCLNRQHCCSWESPQYDGALEYNSCVLKYICKQIKREETLLKKSSKGASTKTNLKPKKVKNAHKV